MSLRAVFIRAKQIGAEVLKRRVLFSKTHPSSKLQDQALGRGCTVESQLLTTETARPVPGWLQKVFIGYNSKSLAANLRQNAALRLISSRLSFGATRSWRFGFGSRAPVYAFLGLTLAAGERSLVEENGAGLDEGLKRLPLETCCELVRMMFNFDVVSNDTAIRRAFESESLPLQTRLVRDGSFGNCCWENGHRAKKKGLPPHPNIVTIYHAFVGQTTVHDLDEARALFPAALPARLHIDGMGRNQTMFLVMKRYDLTLDEYNNVIGCPSQRVAMVMIAQLLEGESHLVHHGIAHRDLKSNNILIKLTAGSPLVVIADFGCCLADQAFGLHLPYPLEYTSIWGNSALMAPEVKTCKPGPGVRIDYTKSDAWAVGAICYEILGLQNPFYGSYGVNSATYVETDLPKLPDNIYPGLVRVVKLLLKKDPAERPTATVVANMLHLLLWQPSIYHWSSWECSKLLPTRITQQQHLGTWVLRVATGMLCQRSLQGHVTGNVEGQRSWLDGTEYQLCVSFMTRVTSDGLLTAANQLLR